MTTPFRMAIVGCGAIAGGYDERSGFEHAFTHAGACRRHPRFELAAIAEPAAERRAEFQRLWGVETAYADYRDMLASGPIDLLSVCVPDHLHGEVIRHAAEHGRVRAILAEKPLAASVAEARELIVACRDRGITLLVNYNRRWDPKHQALRDRLAAGMLGQFQGGVGYYVRGLRHNGTTMINTLRFLLGQDVVATAALRAEASPIPGDMALDGLLTFEGGAQVLIMAADKTGYGHSVFELDLMGNGGRIRLHDNGFQAAVFTTSEYKRYPGVRELSPDPDAFLPESQMDRTLLATLGEMARSLDEGMSTQYSAWEALRDMEIAAALIDSHHCRHPLSV